MGEEQVRFIKNKGCIELQDSFAKKKVDLALDAFNHDNLTDCKFSAVRDGNRIYLCPCREDEAAMKNPVYWNTSEEGKAYLCTASLDLFGTMAFMDKIYISEVAGVLPNDEPHIVRKDYIHALWSPIKHAIVKQFEAVVSLIELRPVDQCGGKRFNFILDCRFQDSEALYEAMRRWKITICKECDVNDSAFAWMLKYRDDLAEILAKSDLSL